MESVRPFPFDLVLAVSLCVLSAAGCAFVGDADREANLERELVEEMFAAHGEPCLDRIVSGVAGVAELWNELDGTAAEMRAFCRENFIADPVERDAAFDRISTILETLWGHLHQVNRELKRPLHLDLGPVTTLDALFAGYSPSAHVNEDFFANRIAFFVALNFPRFPLDEKLRLGPDWSRREWAMARLGDLFTRRVPSGLTIERSACHAAAQAYVYDYNLHTSILLSPDAKELFPGGPRLICHWGIRDEIRGLYGTAGCLEKQEAIHDAMLRIIDQTIPESVIDSADRLWDPAANRLFERREGALHPVPFEEEGNRRYALLLEIFRMARRIDRHHPENPTLIDRKFNVNRQIPEEQVERLFESVLASPVAARVGALIAERLGRPLRPFDIWYPGFKAQGRWSEAELDAIVKARYPTAQAFQDDLPRLLERFGFSPEKAQFLGDRIVVDASRGAGHAMPAAMRTDRVHLRTRIGAEGMDYKGFNIATHELGHNVEQVFSLHGIDHYLLRGVPNSAFTEAIAIIFQNRNTMLLGLEDANPAARAVQALDTFWCAYESGGVGLTEMKVWRWMYENPDATPDALRDAVIAIAIDVWNEFFAPVFGVRDTPILAVYSHVLSDPAYLPNYPLGHILLAQIEEALRGKDAAAEVERLCRQGKLTPRQWMVGAMGTDISTGPLLRAAERALESVR